MRKKNNHTTHRSKPLYRDSIRHFFLGHPLHNSALTRERLGIISALAIFAVDALSSVAYATEEIILALSTHPALLDFSFGISLTIVGLLAIIIISYMQTVVAFPEGGGAYTVAKTYLSESMALIAASALFIDYILTVAVSVSAGMRALSSAFPVLRGHSALFCSIFILFLCWINLRGIRESARLVLVPVYAFILSLLFVGGYGLSVSPDLPSPPWDLLTNFGVILVLLHAFSSGCSAMTGVEALANAGSMLKKPQVKTAQKVLFVMGMCLGTLFLSLTWTAQALHLRPLPEESILSQIIRSLMGEGLFYEGLQILIAGILFLAANTAFAGFPKLASTLAEDNFLPRQFRALGDRLVFSSGILSLTLGALFLTVFFQGNTHNLIPLYAIGVFSAFTFSQAGMAVHWFRSRKMMDRGRGIINGFGSFCTFLALIVTFFSKFFAGAFLVALVLPLIYGVLCGIQAHYQNLYRLLKVTPDRIPLKKKFAKTPKKSIVVPVSQFHLGTLEALILARELSSDVTAVLVDIGQDKQNIKTTREEIEALSWGVRFEVISSPYRSVVEPIVAFIQNLDEKKGQLTTVLLPEFMLTHWWERGLHNHTAYQIEHALGAVETSYPESRVILSVPYYFPHLRQA